MLARLALLAALLLPAVAEAQSAGGYSIPPPTAIPTKDLPPPPPPPPPRDLRPLPGSVRIGVTHDEIQAQARELAKATRRPRKRAHRHVIIE